MRLADRARSYTRMPRLALLRRRLPAGCLCRLRLPPETRRKLGPQYPQAALDQIDFGLEVPISLRRLFKPLGLGLHREVGLGLVFHSAGRRIGVDETLCGRSGERLLLGTSVGAKESLVPFVGKARRVE